MKSKFRALLLLVVLGCAACAGQAPKGIYYTSGKGSVTPDGLHRVNWEPFRTDTRPAARQELNQGRQHGDHSRHSNGHGLLMVKHESDG